MQMEKKLPLPIGVSDFKEMVSDYYYVDKTLFIRDIIDARPKVSLFTRPRRFGKTLNMSMLQTFFEKTVEDNSCYFRNMKISGYGDEYMKYQGKYPVIFLTFKDVKFQTWEDTVRNIGLILRDEFIRHAELLQSEKISEYDKLYFKSIMNGTVNEVDLAVALTKLSKMLCQHCGEKVIIIIDEYDTPIQQGHMMGYYEKVIAFMRNLFSGAFKDNFDLAFGFMTGILRVAKESIFSGMNNLKVNTILEERYSEYFGFTKEEIREILQYYNKTDKYEEICDWYDGYRFGEIDIFNPWSVLNYMDEGCEPRAFWQSTGDNSIIRQIIAEADAETSEGLQELMKGKKVSSYIDTSVIYPEIKNNPSTIYSFLLAAGYLKVVKKDVLYGGNRICHVAIPNKEIFYVYEKEIISALSTVVSQATAIAVRQAIEEKNICKLQQELQKFLIQTVSAFDCGYENFYHGLVLGICAVMNHHYMVESNREAGYGRYDIQLKPKNNEMPGILMELKVAQDDIQEEQISEVLQQLAKGALEQIDTKEYVTALRQDGIKKILKIGMAFYKKHVEIVCVEANDAE